MLQMRRRSITYQSYINLSCNQHYWCVEIYTDHGLLLSFQVSKALWLTASLSIVWKVGLKLRECVNITKPLDVSTINSRWYRMPHVQSGSCVFIQLYRQNLCCQGLSEMDLFRIDFIRSEVFYHGRLQGSVTSSYIQMLSLHSVYSTERSYLWRFFGYPTPGSGYDCERLKHCLEKNIKEIKSLCINQSEIKGPVRKTLQLELRHWYFFLGKY